MGRRRAKARSSVAERGPVESEVPQREAAGGSEEGLEDGAAEQDEGVEVPRRPAIMGKETKVGLFVIMLLLLLFGVVVVQKVRSSPSAQALQGNSDESELLHTAPQFPNAIHGTVQINRADAGKPSRMGANRRGNLVVRQKGSVRAPPRRRQCLGDTRAIKRGQGQLDGKLFGNHLELHPSTKRREHLMADEASGRVLNPGVDDRLRHEPILRSRGLCRNPWFR